jgi:hypothetical protein
MLLLILARVLVKEISIVYMDNSDPIRFLIGIDIFLAYNRNVGLDIYDL